MKRVFKIAGLLYMSASTVAVASTTVLLNTGYNNGIFSVYPAPASDNYWIEIASSAPPVPQAAFVVPPNPAWAAPMSAAGVGSQWISPTVNGASVPGTSGINPAYFIFRKCFCLMRGYKNPSISYQIRGDENTQVWLNSISNVMSTSPSNFTSSSPLSTGSTNNAAWFRTGINCIYVLVQDTGGAVGFNLAGTVSATGLMPVAGAGISNPPSFEPCRCATGATPRGRNAKAAVRFDDRAVVQAIERYAKERARTPAAR